MDRSPTGHDLARSVLEALKPCWGSISIPWETFFCVDVLLNVLMSRYWIIQNILVLAPSCESLKGSFLWSDACRLAQERDALIRWRVLFERSELVRPPQNGVRPLS